MLCAGCGAPADHTYSSYDSEFTSDFALYTWDSVLTFSFENDQLILDEKKSTDLNCTFLNGHFKQSDDYWYSVTSEEPALERKILKIRKDTMELTVSEPVSGGGFASTGVFRNTFLYDISSYADFRIIQYDSDFRKIRESVFSHDQEMIIVLDICSVQDKVCVLLGDEYLNQWIMILDSALNEIARYRKPDEYATLLKMASDDTRLYLTETNRGRRADGNPGPAYRILDFDPDTGQFGSFEVVLGNAYPYGIQYVKDDHALFITHEPWSLGDGVWTIYSLDTGTETVFKCSQLGYEYAKMDSFPFAAEGTDGYYYFFAGNTLYRVQKDKGIVRQWDLSQYGLLYPHTMIFPDRSVRKKE